MAEEVITDILEDLLSEEGEGSTYQIPPYVKETTTGVTKKKISITIDKWLYEKVRKLSSKERKKVSALINYYLEQGLLYKNKL